MAEPMPSVELVKHLQDQGDVLIMPIHDGLFEIASVPTGRKLESLLKFEDERLDAPRRFKGTATVNDLGSFVALTNRGKADNSVLFAIKNPERTACSLTAVLNYNEGQDGPEPGEPRFGDHRIVYAFPLSDEWKAWHKSNGAKMSQADFAEFIEDRVADLIEPPDMAVDGPDVDSTIELARKLGGKFGSPSRLVELSRGMKVNADVRVAGAVNLSSGEGQIQFEETHKDGQGAPLTVPQLFLVAIPVFDAGPLYRIAVRLRYRLSQGSVVWFYELYRPEKSFDHAFAEACEYAEEKTELRLFQGKPEA